MRYSVQPRDWMFITSNGFLSFAKNMGKNIGKDISKSLSSKYSQKCLDHAKQSVTNTLNFIKKNNSKTVEATDDFIGKNIANKITKTPKH